MKKRILALALAGTTAFSVFGAAISANAAYVWNGTSWVWDAESAHVASTNDMYKTYEPVAKTVDATYTAGTDAQSNVVYQDLVTKQKYYKADGTTPMSVEEVKKELLKSTRISSNYTYYTRVGLGAGSEIYVDLNATDADLLDATSNKVLDGSGKAYTLEGSKFLTSATDGNVKLYTIKDNTGKELATETTLQAALKEAAGTSPATWHVQKNITGTSNRPYYVYELENVGSEFKNSILAENVDDYFKYQTSPITLDPTPAVPARGTVTITPEKDANSVEYTWTFNGSTSSDTTIYPWTTETYYPKDENGKYLTSEAVNEAVETPTVYLFDFLPANTVYASSSAVASAYNAYVTAAKKYDIVNASATATAEEIAAAKKAMDDALAAAAKLMDTSVAAWTAEKGDGGSYGIRAEVVDEYENFLSELVLLQRYGNSYVSKTDFKNEYKDRFVSGYFYNPYTGLASKYEWTTDLYNLNDLLDDIYNSSLPSGDSYGYEYLKMNTSELMYLMQQYDKYIGDYIDKAEVSNDDWGDLLVSILQNVSEDDFKTTASYKTFARAAEDAIDAYTYATTSSLVKAAERKMYALIVSGQTTSTGAADAQDELGATVGSLYFNAKAAPAEYETDAMTVGNANLTNYAYISAVTIDGKPTATGSITLVQSSKTTNGYYSLYPAADYKQTDNTAAQFPGNDTNGTSYNVDVTDEYEWFLNVYELAAAVNKLSDAKSVSGIVSAVNDALAASVADLVVTVSAPASYTTAMDETIADYEEALDFYVTGNGVNKEDFNETYYNAYTKALEFADAAEGATQVANARRMVTVAGEALTYQGAQVTVSKNDIKTVETAIKNGNTALETIKNSADYNAAQVTALNKAIAQAQEIVDIYNGKLSNTTNMINHNKVAGVGDKDAIVASDITGAIEAIDAAINYSEVKLGWNEFDEGWKYGYIKEDGTAAYVESGWYKVGASWFYFRDSIALENEWIKEDGKWYYLNSNCAAAYGWAKVDGKWYYFNGDNSMRTGWVKTGGHWYYLNAGGAMVTGWAQIDGKWYYFSKTENAIGQMLANTTTPDGCKVDENGVWIK